MAHASPLAELLVENGMDSYISKLSHTSLESLLDMNEEDILDVATDAGMKKDDRKTFHQLIQRQRGSTELSALVSAHGLGAFTSVLSDSTLQTLVVKDKQELLDFALDAGMKKDDRNKLQLLIDQLCEKTPRLILLLAKEGLGSYVDNLQGTTLQALLEMDDDAVCDVAVDAGMKRADRQIFCKMLQKERDLTAASEGHKAPRFCELLRKEGLGSYVGKLQGITKTLQALLEMDDNAVSDVALDAGMKSADRQIFCKMVQKERELSAASKGQKSCKVAERDRELSAAGEGHKSLKYAPKERELSTASKEVDVPSDLVEFLLQKNMEKYAKKLCANGEGHVPSLLDKTEVELVEVLVEAGVERHDRPKFMELIKEEQNKRRVACTSNQCELSVACEDVDVPSDLLEFLQKKHMEKYAKKLCANGEGHIPMLLDKTETQLIEVLMEAGVEKQDRPKFIELIKEEKDKRRNASSIAAKFAKMLDNACKVRDANTKLTRISLQFKKVYGTTYDFNFAPDLGRQPHKCELSVMEAIVPDQVKDLEVNKEIVILVVGATGAGKSTQVDGLLNYLLGVKWAELIRFKVVDEKTTVTRDSLKQGQTESQTDSVTAYKLPAFKDGPVKAAVTVIDTPGFGDTRGLEFDQKIVDQMRRFFNDEKLAAHVPHLHGVCFITQASANRLTESQIYVWTSILGLFGKDIADNMLMCFTFADGQKPQALNAIQVSSIPMAAHFKFNNSALFVDPEDADSITHMFWDMGQASMENFFSHLMTVPSKSLHMTRQVMDEREKLEVTLTGLMPQIKVVLSKAESFKQESAILEQLSDEMVASENFTYTTTVDKFRKHPVNDGFTTTCMTCNYTCHEDCAFENDDDKKKCCAMNSAGNCTVCPRGCCWDEHRNLPYTLEWYQEEKEGTMEELKQRYDASSKGLASKQTILQGLADDLGHAQELSLTMINTMKACKERLDEIAMRPNTMPSEKYIEMMIQNEKANQKPGYEGRVRMLEAIQKKSSLLKDVTSSKGAGFDPLNEFKKDAVFQKGFKAIKAKPAKKGWSSWWGW